MELDPPPPHPTPQTSYPTLVGLIMIINIMIDVINCSLRGAACLRLSLRIRAITLTWWSCLHSPSLRVGLRPRVCYDDSLDYVMGCGSGQAEVRTMFANFLAMLAVIAHAAKTEMTLSMSRPLRLNADRRQYHSSSLNQHHPKFST